MCGVFAAVRPAQAPPCQWAEAAVAKMRHRGPDAGGAWTGKLPWCSSVKLEWCRVDLGMARLKIVDQSDISVPYQFAPAGVTLAFNGEIYNWRELRAELGGDWETECDAEVLSRLWRRWGPEMLDRLNGMWAMVLVDELVGEVFVARDRAGQKPLYYAQTLDGGLYFASEAKALPLALEETSCPDAEIFEFDWGEATPFRGVRRLNAGHSLLLREPGDLSTPKPKRWWPLPPVEPTDRSYADCLEELTALVIDAVRIRLSSEVKVALQLSGGLDSAIIYHAWSSICGEGAANAGKYCVDFVLDGIDNLSAAQLVAPDVLPVTFSAAEMKEILPQVLYHLDTPATWSAVCLWKLAERIAGDGHRIVLSGEGADELFGGYSRYRILHWLQRAVDDLKLTAYKPTIDYVLGNQLELVAKMLDRSPLGQYRARVTSLVTRAAEGADSLPRVAMRTEFGTTMQVLLRMADRMASAWALENRCPLLDYRVIGLASKLPTAWLITDARSKSILRDVALRVGVHQQVVDEQTKKGLAIPWARWAAELGIETAGGRGAWDRSGFARLCWDIWRAKCLRPADCLGCTTTP